MLERLVALILFLCGAFLFLFFKNKKQREFVRPIVNTLALLTLFFFTFQIQSQDAGTIRYNTNTIEVYDGSSWQSTDQGDTATSCTGNDGEIRLNTTPNPDRLEFCDGTTWRSMEANITAVACTKLGEVTYDAPSKTLRYCNGSFWVEGNVVAAGGGSSCPSDMIGYWPMDENSGTAVAEMVAGYTSTYQGTSINGAPGMIGGAIDLNGTSSNRVEVGDNTFDNMTTSTMCAWVYPRSYPSSYPMILDKSSDGLNGFNFYLIQPSSDGFGYYQNQRDNTEYTIDLGLNGWDHVCASWDGTNGNAGIKLYLNGSHLSSNLDNFGGGGSNNDSSYPLRIGGGNNIDAFDGLIDDVQIYNTVLSDPEISAIYARTENACGGVSSSLIHHWRLDELSGTNAADSIGTIDGTLTNMTATAATVSGQVGTAMNFASLDHIVIPESSNEFENPPFTWTAWIKLDQLPSVSGNNNNVIALNHGSGPWYSFQLWVDDAGDNIKWTVYDTSNTGHTIISDNAVTAGTWIHLAAIVDGAFNTELYVDGVKQSTTQSPGSLKDGNLNLTFSGINATSSIDGDIDDVRMFDRVLTAAEINHLISSSTVGLKQIVLTSGSTFSVPLDWDSSNNTIEVIGGGGTGRSSGSAAGGGGGGAYSKIINATLTAGSTVSYAVGGVAGDTYFCNSTSNCGSIGGSAVIVGAKGGVTATSGTGAAGGQASSGVGDVKYDGGDGGDGGGRDNDTGGGGGGAGGPYGDGGQGGDSIPAGDSEGGGGGGGNGGGIDGHPATNTTDGGDGGNNDDNSGGGIGGAYNVAGTAGTNGGGGGGGGDANTTGGGAGGNGIEWITLGSGGGGGGGGFNGNGANGGLYGAGGGGGNTGGTGAQGVVVIRYGPSGDDITPDAMDWVDFTDESSVQTFAGLDAGINVQISAANGTGTPTLKYRINGGKWTTFAAGSPITKSFFNDDTLQFQVSGTTGHTATITVTNVSDSSTVLDTVVGTVPTYVVLTSGTTWVVPSDFDPTKNSISVIGGGGNGHASGSAAGGGGGGAFSRITNATLTAGATVGIQVGGATQDTYLCNSTSNCGSIGGSAVIVGAKGGSSATNGTGAAGGAAASGVGTVKYSGGSGGTGGGRDNDTGGGGGGAAGPNGDGGAAGLSDPTADSEGGGGGGGNGGGYKGQDAQGDTIGGNGGMSYDQTAGGAGGAFGVVGSPGSNGSGGGGGGDQNTTGGGLGGSGAEFVTAGSGGGGGGGGFDGDGGNGGNYGAGGGGGNAAGAGAPGVIVVKYAAIPAPTPTHHYTFDEGTGTTAADSIGSSDGTLTNTPTWVVDGGSLGDGSIDFDGSDYIAIADNAEWTMSAGKKFAYAMWIKLDSAPGGAFWGPISTPSDSYGFQLTGNAGAVQLNWWDGTTDHLSPGQNIAAGVWHHMVISIELGATNGSNWYLNGVDLGSFTAPNISPNPTALWISNSTGTVLGEIDDVKIFGTTLTASNAAELYNDGLAANDPYESNVVLLIQPDSDDTSIVDYSASAHSITLQHDVALSTAVSDPFGGNGKVIAYDGLGDNLRLSDSDDWYFDGDFTKEYWVYMTSNGATEDITFDWQYQGGSANGGFYLSNNSNIGLRFDHTGGVSSIDQGSDNTAATGEWHHFALSREGSNFRIFEDGVEVATNSDATALTNLSAALNIGGDGGGSSSVYSINGYLGAARLTKGVARYTTDFSPPDAAFPFTQSVTVPDPIHHWAFDESSGTTAADSIGSLNGTLTNSPTWNPLTGAIDGSINFDGTGAYVSIPDSADWSISPGKTLTYSTWFKFDSIPANGDWWRILMNTGGNFGFQLRGTASGTGFNWWSNSVDHLTSVENLQVGTWYHVAAAIEYGATNGSNIYLNGVSIGNFTVANWTYNPSSMRVSQTTPTEDRWHGDIDDLKVFDVVLTQDQVQKMYTDDIASNDPYKNDVVLLVQPDSDDSSIVDYSASGHTVTAQDNAALSTTVSDPWDGSAQVIALDGSNDYLSLADSDDWYLDGDFTTELWVYHDSGTLNGSSIDMYFQQWQNGSNNWSFSLDNNSNSGLQFGLNGSYVKEGSDRTDMEAVWTHVAAVRQGNEFTIFKDGVQVDQSTDSTSMTNNAASLLIGNDGSSAWEIDGYITGARITKGVARYTTNFTPPADPFPQTFAPSGSVVFNGTNEDMRQTFSGTGNRKTFTVSTWFKIGGSGGTGWETIIAQGTGSHLALQLNNGRVNVWDIGQGGEVLRGNNAISDNDWHHIVFVFDSTDSTATDRVQVYIDNVRETSWAVNNIASWISLNDDFNFNTAHSHTIGYLTGVGEYWDGKLSETHFIDGQALGPSNFAFDDGGTWTPKRYEGTYGTNGFYVFGQGFGSSDIGEDRSGNNNDFTTLTNMDSSNYDTDVPPTVSGGGGCTNGGVDVGGYCWWITANNESCNTKCGSYGMSVAAATTSYAGQTGSDANCDAVLDALGLSDDGSGASTAANAKDCRWRGSDGRRRRGTNAPDYNSTSTSWGHACSCE